MPDARQFVVWAFKLRGCSDCGRTPIEAGGELALADLHCHHFNPADKGICGRGVVRGSGVDANRGTIAELFHELAKCGVLCGECHRRRHRNGHLGNAAGEAQMPLFASERLTTWRDR